MTGESIRRERTAGPDASTMSRPRRWAAVIVSTLIVATAGIMLHYAYEWSGGNRLVALFAAVNESTWEHLKLAFWPALLLTPVQRRLYGPRPGWPAATATRCLLPPVLIVCGFYGYTALLGMHFVAADIALFVVSVFSGESVGHSLIDRPVSPRVRAASFLALAAATLAFATLTYFPPDLFLFDDPLADSGRCRCQPPPV